MSKPCWSTSLRNRLPVVIEALLLLVVPAAVTAQDLPGDQPAEDWYQVEVLVFSQLYPADTELYDETGELAWPPQLTRLSASPSELLADPLQIGSSPVAAAADAASETLPVEQAVEEPELPNVLQRLDEAERLRSDTAAQIRRSRGYRLLVHEAWRQPILEGDDPTRLLITGGEAHGGHFELEGFLILSRSRYLHADVALRLARYERTADWSGETLQFADLPPEPANPADIGPGPPIEANQAIAERAVEVSLGDDGSPQLALTAADEFVPVEAWVLKEKRRLKRGELHYLDHPRFGVLIYVESWSPAPIE